ncbi:MAG: sugar ABC transporter permease [Candidatus Micrarchaeia archaeon]
MVKYRIRKSFTSLFFFPIFLYLVIFLWYPFIYGIWMSAYDWVYIVTEEPKFIGFTNYIDLFTSPIFHEVLYVTSIYLTATIIQLILGLIAALILNELKRGKSIFAGILIIGYAIPEMASGSIWKFIFDANFGVLNYYLQTLGFIREYIPWLTNPNFCKIAITLANAWKHWPFIMLILLASLQGIPKDFYDAAKVFGANTWQRFRYVTLPQLKSAIIIATILRICWNLAKFFK